MHARTNISVRFAFSEKCTIYFSCFQFFSIVKNIFLHEFLYYFDMPSGEDRKSRTFRLIGDCFKLFDISNILYICIKCAAVINDEYLLQATVR